tara:strand:+ start:3118 stop:4827 length:1710 start_codon:yes stop_codon:yes gene_type:complete
MPSIKFAFDGENVEAQRAARKAAATLVSGVSKSTEKSIRNLIIRAIRDGIPPYDAARLIKPMIGLNDMQQAAALNYRSELVNSGLSQSAVDRKVDRYIQKALRRRAKTIARTEIMESLNAGQEASWGQAQQQGFLGSDAKKKWITTSFGACPICTALDGDVVGISKYFKSIAGPVKRPVAHPNCRCAVVPVPGKGVPAGPVTPVTPVRPKGAIGYVSKVVRAKRATTQPKAAPKAAPQPGEYTGPEIRKRVAELEAAPDIAANQALLAEKLQEMKFLKLKLQRALKGQGKYKGFGVPREIPTAKDIQKLVDFETALLKEISALNAKVGGREFVHDLVLTKTQSNFRATTYNGRLAGDYIPRDIGKAKAVLNKGIHKGSPRAQAAVGDRDAEGIDWVRRLFGDKAGKDWAVRINNKGTNLFEGRSNYDSINNVINMSVRGGIQGRTTVVHEMGHVIEQWTGYHKESWKWVLKRSPGEKLKQLKKLHPDRNFNADEWAFEDKFLDTYIGKKYDSASEVFSMGLQYLYKDPIAFMKKDPDMFDFIIGSVKKIKGGYKKPDVSKWWLDYNRKR